MNQETRHNRKKVLFLITKGTWGGAQRYVFDLATALPRDRFDVSVGFGLQGPLALKLKEAGLPTHHIPSLERDVSALLDVRSFREIYRLLRAEKPDVVHLNSSKAAALGALASRLAGIKKIVFTVHGWPFGEQRNIVAKILLWKISWLTALLSHKIICVSEHDLRHAKRMPFVGKKAIRIYNGVEPIPFGSGDIIRKAFPSGVKITGTIGELTKNKNQISLIEQARQHSDVYVAIVGTGEDQPALEQKIKKYGLENRVKLLGFIPANDALRGFDTFALPSIKEGLPYVLLEAKQAGLPIVANRVGGVGEILDATDMREFALDTMVEKTIAQYLTAQAG